MGHISRECNAPRNRRPNQVQFQTRGNIRPINYLDYEETEYYEDEEFEEYDDVEAELYAFKRKEPYSRDTREAKRRAIPRSESVREELNRTNVPDIEMGEVESSKVKKPRRKMLPAPIEQLTEFNVANYLRDLHVDYQ
jgi:hypothetical protein